MIIQMNQCPFMKPNPFPYAITQKVTTIHDRDLCFRPMKEFTIDVNLNIVIPFVNIVIVCGCHYFNSWICLNLSNTMAETAALTFKEFVLPFIGIVALKSQDSRTFSRIPFPSLPTTMTVFPLY